MVYGIYGRYIYILLLSKRLMLPLHTFVRGSKCRCGKLVDESGDHFTSSCNVGSSLHNIHNSVLRTVDRAARSHGLSITLELATFSSPHDPLLVTKDLTDAIVFANKAASITVQHRGNYAPNLEEIDGKNI